jgi:chromosome segregation ATPase
LEKRWNQAQANAQGYYNELHAMAGDMADSERYEMLLSQYGNNYNDISHHMHNTTAAITGQPAENKTINIIRHDPRAAEEIMKLRNVAADQYRVISNLQRKLEESVTAEEKDLVIKELEQQLQRQVRFVQESDTCVQLLEEELNKANEKIAEQEGIIEHEQELEEENQRIKETLHSFTHESKELLGNLEDLERENDELKTNLEHTTSTASGGSTNLDQIQSEYMELRKQYTELEEKYLELKFK